MKYLLVLLLLAPGTALATPFLNPDPGTYADDIDGDGFFTPMDGVLSLELIDLSNFLTGVGNTFGFFFEGADVSDASNLFTIFDETDQDPDPAAPGGAPFAGIDFLAGVVYDIDDGSAVHVQDTFAGSGNIGFFLQMDPALSLPTFFSVPSLNAGVADVFAAFPFLSDPERFLTGFVVYDPLTDEDVTVGVQIVEGVTPSAVPEPSTMLLLGLGALTLFDLRRRSSCG